jgi:hypothetical protein
MAKKSPRQPFSTKLLGPYPLDCAPGLSLYEVESLAAEAILAARKKRKKRLKAIKTKATA